VLGHDFAPNEVYLEAKTIGRDFARLSPHLCGMKKENSVAIVVSNEAYSALKWFGIDATADGNGIYDYNDVLRWMYDALYKMNVEVDFVEPSCTYLERYSMVILPALYAVSEEDIKRFENYVKEGGYLIGTFKTAYADENVKVYHDQFPHGLSDCFGVSYSLFTFPKQVGLSGTDKEQAELFMELLKPNGAQVLHSYEHPAWNGYAAVTRNQYGKGTAEYIGCKTSEECLQNLMRDALKDANLWQPYNEMTFPVIIRKGIAEDGCRVWFYFNYSGEPVQTTYVGADARVLLRENETLTGEVICSNSAVTIDAWGMLILKEME
jgi:beta-galactosidase